MRKLKDLSDIEKSEIVNQRKLGATENQISSKFDISLRQYYNLLKLNKIERKNKVIRYNFDENYFESIDTEDKAYFLGFIVADGSVNSISNVIQITQKEPDILYEFKRYIKYEGDLIKSKNRDVFDIKISSSKMKSDLLKLGISPNKTISVNYPSIPENLQSHFMRGVFDGDGTTHNAYFSIVGTEKFLAGIRDYLKQENINLGIYNAHCKSKDIKRLAFNNRAELAKIFNYLYDDSNIFMERKKNKFINYFKKIK
jgi:hypothetical protein